MAGRSGSDRGADLERRVGRLEFADGALVRLRWPVAHQVSGRRRTITDVDVLVVDFDARLRPLVSIIECKSARGQAGEQDRLLWLAGLRTLLGADRAVLVRESITGAGRDLSRKLSVDLLGSRELERRESDHQWMPEQFGLVGGSQSADWVRRTDEQVRTIGSLPSGLLAFLRHESLLAEPHRVLGAVATLADATRTGAILPEPAGTLLAADVLLALIVAALRTGARLDLLGADGVRTEIEDGIATGDPHDRQVLKVVDIADALLREQLSRVHRAYVDSGARPLELSYPSLREAVASPPSWLGRFYDIAERYRRRPTLTRQLPQTADLVLYDALPGGRAWQAPAFDHLFTPQHRQVLLVALDALDAAAPHLAARLARIPELPFNRSPAAVPDRLSIPPGGDGRRIEPGGSRNDHGALIDRSDLDPHQ
jgi:hypothetical protein